MKCAAITLNEPGQIEQHTLAYAIEPLLSPSSIDLAIMAMHSVQRVFETGQIRRGNDLKAARLQSVAECSQRKIRTLLFQVLCYFCPRHSQSPQSAVWHITRQQGGEFCMLMPARIGSWHSPRAN